MTIATVHLDVILPGGFKASLSLKITDAKQLAELGTELENCGILPCVPTYMVPQRPAKSNGFPTAEKGIITPASPPPPIPKRTEQTIPPKPSANGNKQVPLMHEFIPQNITKIVDIEVKREGPRDEIVNTGKTEDGEGIKIDRLIKQQLHTIGYDVSTWDLPEPHLRNTINVTTNSYGILQQIQNMDGVWTWARHGKNIKEGDILCIRDDDGDIAYHVVSKVKRMTLEFEGDQPALDNAGSFAVCMTPPPNKEIIPF